MPEEGPQPSASASTGDGLKRIPKGVVLGKDGKPCRSCTSFASWAANTKQATSKSSTTAAGAGAFGALAGAATQAPSGPPADCPPDVEALGRSSWTLLHSIAASYPSTPSQPQQNDMKSFIGLFSKIYPCWVCADDFQEYIGRVGGVKAGSRDEFGRWLCEAHNEVNRKLGKDVFDCGRWEERWRTGWKDGRCD